MGEAKEEGEAGSPLNREPDGRAQSRGPVVNRLQGKHTMNYIL